MGVRLELRRVRYSQLGNTAGIVSAQERAKADAQLLAKKESAAEDTFLLAIDAPGISATALQDLPYVSQKGAVRTAVQLHDLLRKPGRESLLEMYSADVAEFVVQVADRSGGGADEDRLDPAYLPGLTL